MGKLKNCQLCGNEFETIPNGHTRIYCFECSPQYIKGDSKTHAINITAKRRAIKRAMIVRLGGKCSRCGYDKFQGALQFHHIDPSVKDFGIGSWHDYKSIERIQQEVDKCILLCANCHAEEHQIE